MEYYKNLSLEDIVANIEGIGEVREEWRDIVGFDCDYKVSNFGRLKTMGGARVKVHSSGKEMTQKYPCKILKQSFRVGYLFVGLYKNGKQKMLLTHRLVGIAFIPNPQNKPQVNHISGIKTDNFIGKLEWATSSENCIHALDSGLSNSFGENCHFSKLKEHDVLAIKHEWDKGIYTKKAIADKFNVSRTLVSSIVRGKVWKRITADKILS